MKKKIIYFLVVGILILFIWGFYTHLIDSARVRNGIEPKYTLKVVSKTGEKVTYFGLGYKVIRYVSVSPNDPYENNIGVKYGSWFMNYSKDFESDILEIVDRTVEINDFACDTMLEKFYEDDNYIYYFDCVKSNYVVVKFKDNSQMTVEEALKIKKISIKDLDEYKIDYIKESKIQLIDMSINDYKFGLLKNNDCVNPKLYYQENDIKVYLLCFDDIYLIKDDYRMSLKYYFQNVNQTFEKSIDDIVKNLNLYSIFKDGGTKIYKNDNLTIIKCNTIDGNKDIYIGNNNIDFKQEYCK